jgi:hypothetical protein
LGVHRAFQSYISEPNVSKANSPCFFLPSHAQDATKGSQGAGRVDEALDRTNAADEPEAKPKAPARPAGGKKGGKKGRR